MKIGWSKLNSFDDWAGTLKTILDEAQRCLQDKDINRRVEVQNLLLDFITNSPNAIAAVLDDIAKKAINDIFLAAVDEAIAGISGRTAELALHVKTINAVTQTAQGAAKSIRLERATKVVTSATQIVRELNELSTALAAGAEDEALISKIEKAVKSLQDVVPLAMNVKAVG